MSIAGSICPHCHDEDAGALAAPATIPRGDGEQYGNVYAYVVYCDNPDCRATLGFIEKPPATKYSVPRQG